MTHALVLAHQPIPVGLMGLALDEVIGTEIRRACATSLEGRWQGPSVIQLIRAAHSHPRSRAVAAASVRLRAPNLAIADER